MLPYIQSELNVYYSNFISECKKASEGLESLRKIADKIKEDFDQQTPPNKVKVFQHLPSIKLLITFGDALEKFNNDIELCFNRVQPQLYENVVRAMQLPIFESKTIFKCDLSAYRTGTTGECIITYIKDVERDLCFIADIGRTEFMSNNFNGDIRAKLEGSPKEKIVYGVHLNDKVFRGVRVHDESSLDSYRINLIDIGEVIEIPTDSQLIYHLAENARFPPPAAILCLVEKVDETPINCLKRILAKKHFTFKVNNVCKNMLHIELFSQANVFKKPNQPKQMSMDVLKSPAQAFFDSSGKRSVFNTLFVDLKLDNPPTDPSSGDMNEQCKNSHLIQNLSQIELNSLQAPYCYQISDFSTFLTTKTKASIPVVPKQLNLLAPVAGLNKTGLTMTNMPGSQASVNNQSLTRYYEQDSVDSLNNNLFNSTMDIPKSAKTDSDASRLICNLNNNARCLTGAHSKNNSMFMNQSNQKYSLNFPIDELFSINLPAVGETICIFPTFVINVEQFYAQINAKPYTDQLDEMQIKFNQVPNSLKPLFKLPAPGELILARYNLDNNIYRAQVKEALNQNSFRVFYLDYGNIEVVQLNALYQWEPYCNKLPFQSVFCVISNVKIRKHHDKDAIDYLKQKILNKQFDATVKSNSDNRLLIRLTDSEGFDVGEELCAKELALLAA